MSVYSIADLHLAKDIDKPMDVFNSFWDNYMDKIKENWEAKVKSEDTVLIPGDISWATYLNEINQDFEYIESLPGKKILSRGNHDYWWTTVKKMERFTEEKGYNSITFLQNKAMEVEDFIVGATRGWILPGDSHFGEDDTKIYDRELIRLELCIKDIQKLDPEHKKKHIIMLHFPPITKASPNTDFSRKLEEGNIDICIYGHLHGKGHMVAKEGEANGVLYRCVASDFISFNPINVTELIVP